MTTSLPAADSSPNRGGHSADTVGISAFPRISVLLHWTVAALVLTMFCVGVLMKQIGDGPWADTLYTFHKTAGAVLLLLVLARLAYRLVAYLTGHWRKGAGSHPVHAVLYFGLVLIPLLGLAGISDFGARTIYFGWQLPTIWPEGAGYADVLFKSHAIMAFSLIGLVAVHVGLALSDYIQRGAREMPFYPAPHAETSSPAAPDMP
jgi:cytochrome b561